MTDPRCALNDAMDRAAEPALARAALVLRADSVRARLSWQTRLLHLVMRLAGFKKNLASAAAVREHVQRLQKRPLSHRPSGLGRGVRVAMQAHDGWPVYHTVPVARPESSAHMVYLHGGGYINEIKRRHWRLIGELTLRIPARCIVPIYPLASTSTAATVVPTMADMLHSLLDTVGAENVTIIGDSAGAGLALAASQVLRDRGGPQPRALVLISPWLDATLSGGVQSAMAARDPLLDIAGLVEAGRLYAGSLGAGHRYASPLNGNLEGLPPLTIFSGTSDLLHADSLALAARAAQHGSMVDLHVGHGLSHVYPLLPTPEGRAARQQIVAGVVESRETGEGASHSPIQALYQLIAVDSRIRGKRRRSNLRPVTPRTSPEV